ncbi:MAG TPA: nucleotidyltransferase family protein [Pirellulales bacterium]|nr:nucleotidyltransferase family protein [Pirellulales bacterium]
MSQIEYGPISLDRMFGAMEKVRERLLRATAALETANIPYAVVGGHAVAAWVSKVDEAAVRSTPDVDILIRREDLPRVKAALAEVGFIHAQILEIDAFLDGPTGRARDAVHILFADERVKPHDLARTPDVQQSQRDDFFQVVVLEGLVTMKLTSFRDKDRTHLRDLLELGLIDASWLERLPAELAERLQRLLDDPTG